MLSVQDLSLQICTSFTDYAASEQYTVEIYTSRTWDSHSNTHENPSLNSKAAVSQKS